MKHLTLKSFAESAEKAIFENRLAIQNENGLIEYLQDDAGPACMNTYPPSYFDGKVCHCIVGTALDMSPDDSYVDMGVFDLKALGIATLEAEASAELGYLQASHDGIVSALKTILRETPHPLSDERQRAMTQWREQKAQFMARVETFIAEQKEAA